LTLPISDSLNATTSCIELRSLRTANEELEEPPVLLEALEPVAERPVAEAPAAPVELAVDPLDELLDALVVPLPETTSPTWPESETIVPLSGAYSLVSWTACSSLCTLSVSLLTAALAEARFASRVAVLIVDLDELEPELDSLLSPSRVVEVPLPEELVVVDVERLLGVVVAGVVLAAGVVAAGVVLVGVVVAGVVLAGVVVAGTVVGGVVVPVAVVCVGAAAAAVARGALV
jgi:hypothetical protein